MALSDLLNIAVSVSAAKAQGFTGFGIPLVLSHSPPGGFTPRTTRSYSTIAGVGADYGVHTPEYLAANAFFAQTPQPPTLKIGAASTKPTQQWTLKVPLAQDNTNYVLTIDDTSGVAHVVSINSGGGSSVSSILAALKTAIDALSLALTVVNVGPGTDLTITANSAGAFWGLSVADLNLLAIQMTHADPGVAADLTAIALADPTWYFLEILFPSIATVEAAAAWVESNKKLYIQASADSEIATVAVGSAADVAEELQDSAYTRSSVWYNPFNDQFFDAALMGVLATFAPGGYTSAWKTVAGVNPGQTLTETWRTNILAKNANVYENLATVNITEGGTCASGEFIDVVQFVDWLANQIQIGLFNLFTSTPKVPYTDAGYAQVQSVILAALKAGVASGGLASFPKPACDVPLASSRSSTDRAARNFTGITFSGQLAGAVHSANPINGTLVQ